MTREELDSLTDIGHFTTLLFFVILRRETYEWLETSECDLDVQFARYRWSLSQFSFFQTDSF